MVSTNHLIDDNELIDLSSLVSDKIRQFHELIAGRQIRHTENLQLRTVSVSKYLVDILLNNLLSNAIRHNNEYGELRITLNNEFLVIKNTGLDKPLIEDKIFERFNKSNKSDGIGLGLALVKNICSLYGWKITYAYKDHFHQFKIEF